MTALLAITETFYRYNYQVVTDTPFLVGVLSFLVGYEALIPREDDTPARRRAPWWAWLALGFGIVVMCTFRPNVITFLGALGLATLYHLARGPNRLRHVFIGVLAVACWLGFRAADPRRSAPGDAAYREERLKTLLTEQRSYAMHRMFTLYIPEMLSENGPEAVFGIEFGTGIDEVLTVTVIALDSTHGHQK